jgi:hypothetical protein
MTSVQEINFNLNCMWWPLLRPQIFFRLRRAKNISKSFTVNFIEKKIGRFFKKFEKKNFATEKRASQEKSQQLFPGKSDMTLCWVLA